MFLNMTLKRNPQIIKEAINLHRKGEIYPNTYVLDIDTIKENTKKLVQQSEKYNISLYMMTKQIGRNPYLAKVISDCGISKAVAVDPWEAITLAKAGIKLGNVGHLVQIPSSMIREILSYDPEVITVFTKEKAREISEEAVKIGKKQAIILKVFGEDDEVYEGQAGGFKESELIKEVKEIMKLPGVRIIGVTAFPCFLYDSSQGKIEKTSNANTLIRCAKMLNTSLGIEIQQINAPSATAVSSISMLHQLGATHGEPGHAITGTTPLHGDQASEEIPAMVYVSEISHYFQDKAYSYGGGFYKRSRMEKALVGKSFEDMTNNIFEVEEVCPESIDYYGILRIGNRKVEVGDSVIYAFRTQIFVTRSEVALVEGIQRGTPKIVGIYDSLGQRLR